MPYSYARIDHNPLCHETELVVNDLKKLAQQVGLLLLGKHRHVASILAAKNRKIPSSTDVMIDRAQKQLSVTTDIERWKRDGWLFQMMTWISVRLEQPGINLISQAPHTNPAQHGIDGLAIVLTSANTIKALIIAEDKYTEKPRSTIKEKVWPEFKLFEKGEFDSQLVTQTTMLLGHLDDDEIDRIIENDIYKTSNRIYRVGITPIAVHSSAKLKKKLFKGYDKCVKGPDLVRRQSLTFSQPNIRKWMDDFSSEIFDFLETQRP
ncbi:MAG: hypothetical protein BGO88_08495 [Flavobacterium sp. 38-13]|uniref:hypothetical protein n=1 Tax=Flavobacterium sp. 38-13 TaxID=1896168 RepID=UPI00095AF5B8|nr:hypothetical protein [Flavobacterium sp. 38-13]OJX49785.1 MAG: hypothetical protein BGO88_08495 [Flavobacterium sp. 38-13]